MGSNKQKKRKLLLNWLFAINFFVSILAPFQCMAGLDTEIPPSGRARDTWDDCSLNDFQSKARNHKWWETPLSAVFDASVAVGEQTFDNVAGGAKGLMIIGGCLWVAIFLLKVEAGLLETDPMENLTKIGGLVLRMGVAGALLTHRNFFFGYFVSPIIEAGAGFVTMEGDEPVVHLGSDGGLRDATDALMTMATNAHNSAAALQGTGRWVKCLSKIHVLDILVKIWFWDGGMFFSGCLMQFAGWLLIAVFPFFLVDAGFRLGIVAALCPLFIIAWVFESTRSYATKGLQAVLNIAFTFMLIRIAMAIAMKLIAAAAGIDIDNAPSMNKEDAACNYKSWTFTDGVCDQDVDANTGNIFAIIIATAYGLLLLKNAAKELANYFASTSFSNDTAFQAAKGGAQAVATAGHQAVAAGKAIQHGAERLKESKLGQKVGSAVKNSRLGKFVQQGRENQKARISAAGQAIGDGFRQGALNVRNSARSALGMQSVQEMRDDRQASRTASVQSSFKSGGAGEKSLNDKKQAYNEDLNKRSEEARKTLNDANASKEDKDKAQKELDQIKKDTARGYQPTQEDMKEAIAAERAELGRRRDAAMNTLENPDSTRTERRVARQEMNDIRAQEKAIAQYENGTDRYNRRNERTDFEGRAATRRSEEAVRHQKGKDAWNELVTRRNSSTSTTPAPGDQNQDLGD